jgi:hypothetical protein
MLNGEIIAVCSEIYKANKQQCAGRTNKYLSGVTIGPDKLWPQMLYNVHFKITDNWKATRRKQHTNFFASIFRKEWMNVNFVLYRTTEIWRLQVSLLYSVFVFQLSNIESLVPIYQTTRCQMPDDIHIHDDLKYLYLDCQVWVFHGVHVEASCLPEHCVV